MSMIEVRLAFKGRSAREDGDGGPFWGDLSGRRAYCEKG